MALGTSSLQATAAKLYKWTDADGNVSYQDRPPPKNSKSEILQHSVSSGQRTPSSGSNAAPRDPVVVYTLDNCNSCEILLLRLKQMDVPTEERSLIEDRAAQKRIFDMTGSMTAPSVFIGGNLVSPLTDSSLRSGLEEAGYNLPDGQSDVQQQAEDSE